MNSELEEKSAPATDWAQVGLQIEEMTAAGLLVELHKTQGKGAFRWSFAMRSTYRGDKRWFYGETPGQAVARGHDRWVAEWETRQE